MAAKRDFRDLLAECAWHTVQRWGIQDQVASQEDLAQAARLGDESTFLNVAAPCLGKDRQHRLSALFPYLASGEGCEHLVQAGRRWNAKGIVSATAKALTDIKQSLLANWSPARVGMMARALLAITASRLNPIAGRLGAALEAEADPVSLITAYAGAFRRNDQSTLQAVDTVIIEDPVLGTLAVEMAGRLLNHIGAADLLDQPSRDKVVNRLALLIDEMLKGADRQESASLVSNQ